MAADGPPCKVLVCNIDDKKEQLSGEKPAL